MALWDACDAALSSPLSYPELRAVLAAARRNNDLDARGFEQAEENWERFWATRPVELTTAVERHAGELMREHSLRGVAGGVHLASALAIGDPALIFAVWDRRLRAEPWQPALARSDEARPDVMDARPGGRRHSQAAAGELLTVCPRCDHTSCRRSGITVTEKGAVASYCSSPRTRATSLNADPARTNTTSSTGGSGSTTQYVETRASAYA